MTGASGFVAAWVCQDLLESGYSVRGVVRSAAKGDYLKELFKKFGDKFSYVIVENIEKKGAFDAAMEGVHGVAHTASPVPSKEVKDIYEDLINPAVNGTLSVLESAKKSGVQRVVYTSSYAAVNSPKGPQGPDHVFTEKDWNVDCPKAVKENGNDCPFMEAYRASKTLAERSAWDFMETQKPGFDLVTLCPPWVFGPAIHQVASPESLNSSLKLFYNILHDHSAEYLKGSFVDVRDLARAHLQSLVTDCAGGQRYAISNTLYTFNDFIKTVLDNQSKTGQTNWSNASLIKTDDSPDNPYDSSKSKEQLGLKYRPMETTVLDTEAYFRKLAQK